jgi:hypothetical protein
MAHPGLAESLIVPLAILRESRLMALIPLCRA